jgi:Na+/melibiose symporter-like transporter
MKFRHYFLFVVFAIATVVSLWAVAHIYFGVFFPSRSELSIQPINNLLVCLVLGMLVLAGRQKDKIKSDLVVDFLLLPILIVAGFWGPPAASLYIWLLATFAVLLPSAFVRGSRRSATAEADPRQHIEKHVVHNRTPPDGGSFG